MNDLLMPSSEMPKDPFAIFHLARADRERLPEIKGIIEHIFGAVKILRSSPSAILGISLSDIRNVFEPSPSPLPEETCRFFARQEQKELLIVARDLCLRYLRAILFLQQDFSDKCPNCNFPADESSWSVPFWVCLECNYEINSLKPVYEQHCPKCEKDTIWMVGAILVFCPVCKKKYIIDIASDSTFLAYIRNIYAPWPEIRHLQSLYEAIKILENTKPR